MTTYIIQIDEIDKTPPDGIPQRLWDKAADTIEDHGLPLCEAYRALRAVWDIIGGLAQNSQPKEPKP